eukprot:GDKJ01012640.1.p1 GENE.GDKJ01012640.1~~GDKJ01012640.1.p1  ORF type:complete len:427 (+),score=92.10 GDKJ01012640.1:148-1281(+)
MNTFDRAQKKRESSFKSPTAQNKTVRRLTVDPEKSTGFNFTKANPDEKILEDFAFGIFSGDDLVKEIPCSLIINSSPFCRFHSLFLPFPQTLICQILTEDSCLAFMLFLSSISAKGLTFRGIFNSAGAFASVNHQHFHTILLDQLLVEKLPIECFYEKNLDTFKSKTDENGVTILTSFRDQLVVEEVRFEPFFFTKSGERNANSNRTTTFSIRNLSSTSSSRVEEYTDSTVAAAASLRADFSKFAPQTDAEFSRLFRIEDLIALSKSVATVSKRFRDEGVAHNVIYFPSGDSWVVAVYPRLLQKCSSVVANAAAKNGGVDNSPGFCVASIELAGMIMLQSEADFEYFDDESLTETFKNDIQLRGEERQDVLEWWNSI